MLSLYSGRQIVYTDLKSGNMRKIVLTLLGIMFSAVAYCQSDFEIAQEFMSGKGVMLDQKPTTRGGGMASVFTGADGNGFAIVKDGIVVGYSTTNTATECLVRANTRSYTPTPKTPIDPIVVAEWGQTVPFNLQTPIVDNGFNAPAGCGAVALGEIMYYYKNTGCEALSDYIVYWEGYVGIEGGLPATTFNWDLILPRYDDGYTEEQAEEVAKLMKYIGCATKSMYAVGYGGSYLNENDLPALGFSTESYSVTTPMTDKELEALLDKELEKGRPLLLAGYNITGTAGHWYVVDGRDDTGRYHINFGSGGCGNGFYIVSQEEYKRSPDDDPMLNNIWVTVPIMPKGWTTSVTTTKNNQQNGRVYNLQGQSVKTPSRGIYIKDGKKYIAR